LQYYDISAKSNFQYEKPFVWLLRKMVNDNSLTLVEAPMLEPAEVNIDQEQLDQMNAEIKEAEQMELPDDEDDF